MINYGLAASRSKPPAKPAFRETKRWPLAARRHIFKNCQKIERRRWAVSRQSACVSYPIPCRVLRSAAPSPAPLPRTISEGAVGSTPAPRSPCPCLGRVPRVPHAPRGADRVPGGLTGYPGGCRDPPGASPGLPLGLSLSLFLCVIFARFVSPPRLLFADVCRCCLLSQQGLGAQACPGCASRCGSRASRPAPRSPGCSALCRGRGAAPPPPQGMGTASRGD